MLEGFFFLLLWFKEIYSRHPSQKMIRDRDSAQSSITTTWSTALSVCDGIHDCSVTPNLHSWWLRLWEMKGGGGVGKTETERERECNTIRRSSFWCWCVVVQGSGSDPCDWGGEVECIIMCWWCNSCLEVLIRWHPRLCWKPQVKHSNDRPAPELSFQDWRYSTIVIVILTSKSDQTLKKQQRGLQVSPQVRNLCGSIWSVSSEAGGDLKKKRKKERNARCESLWRQLSVCLCRCHSLLFNHPHHFDFVPWFRSRWTADSE